MKTLSFSAFGEGHAVSRSAPVFGMPTTPKKRPTMTTRFIMHDLTRRVNVSNAAAPLPASPLGSIAQGPSSLENSAWSEDYKRQMAMLATARRLLPKERIAHCQWSIAPQRNYVTIEVDANKDGAKICNLVRCDSSSCAWCARARSEQDRHELSIAIAQAEKRGWYPVLLTFTLSHHIGDKLTDLERGLRTAFDRVFSGRWYQDFKHEWFMIGKITARETTRGENGWHPHLHVLAFFEREYDDLSIAAMEQYIGRQWREKLQMGGFSASLEHGVFASTGKSDIAAYIAKFGREPVERFWSAEHEMTMHVYKKPKVGGVTPFQLLGAAAGLTDDLIAVSAVMAGNVANVRLKASAAYCEFFRAMKGRARLHWGDMWRLLDMDAAIADYDHENPPKDADTWVIFVCPRGEIWNYLRGVKTGVDLRGELLDVCATKDAGAVQAWLGQHRIKGGIPPDAFMRSDDYR